MTTCAEHLPIELWITIFYYFEVHDLFQSFYNLNSYFNKILYSNYLLFNIQLEKSEKLSPWSPSILNRIICLKSSTHGQGKHLSEFFHWHGNKLRQLKSLTIEIKDRELSTYCIQFIKTHPIEYIYLTCIPNETLLQGILSSPILRKCRLYFSRSITNLNQNLSVNSNIEILFIKLKDNSNYLILNQFLSHMPKLKSLEIIGDHVHYYFNSFFNKSLFYFSKLKKVKLVWLRPSMKSDYFQNLLSIAPSIEHIYLGIYCYRFNELLFENFIKYWWPCLVNIPFIKIIIQCQKLDNMNDNNEQILKNYCRDILTTVNNRNDVFLKIKWIEENCETHTIKITILKSL